MRLVEGLEPSIDHDGEPRKNDEWGAGTTNWVPWTKGRRDPFNLTSILSHQGRGGKARRRIFVPMTD